MSNGVLNTDNQAEIERLQNILSQLQLGIQRTQGGGVLQGDEQTSMLADLQQRQAATMQQLEALTGGTQAGQQATQYGGLLAEQLSASDEIAQLEAERDRLRQSLQQRSAGMTPQQAQMLAQPTAPPPQFAMSEQDLGALYATMAAGADDPTAIGMDYAKRMAGRDILATQASQQRTGGFNPIVDDKGRVYFPRRQADGSTGVTPALDAEGNHMQVDPRYSTIDLGGGATGRIQVSGGAGGTGVTPLTTPTTVQTNIGDAKALEAQQEAERRLPGLENAFAREGGAYDTVNRLIDHPARELMTGKSTIVGTPLSFVPGLDATEFRTLENKLKSQSFINSIMELRASGGTVGQITEREGDKLQSAALALNRAAQEGDYLEELVAFRNALARYMLLYRQQAGVEDPYLSTIGEAGIDLRYLQQGGQQQQGDGGATERQQELLERARNMPTGN